MIGTAGEPERVHRGSWKEKDRNIYNKLERKVEEVQRELETERERYNKLERPMEKELRTERDKNARLERES